MPGDAHIGDQGLLRCPACGEEKPANGNYFRTSHGRVVKGRCRDCTRAKQRRPDAQQVAAWRQGSEVRGDR